MENERKVLQSGVSYDQQMPVSLLSAADLWTRLGPNASNQLESQCSVLCVLCYIRTPMRWIVDFCLQKPWYEKDATIDASGSLFVSSNLEFVCLHVCTYIVCAFMCVHV